MNRGNEGYALPFVLVVSIVMCLIAVTVMTFSLNNLQAQQASIGRMQSKYEATGQIEQLIAKIVEENTGDPTKEYQCREEDNMAFAVNNDAKQFTVAVTVDPDRAVWVVAVLEATGNTENFEVTRVERLQGTFLTVNGCNGLKYVEYRVVDEETAREYVPHLKQSEKTESEVGQ